MTIPPYSPLEPAIDSFFKTRLHSPPEMIMKPRPHGPVDLTPSSCRGALNKITRSKYTKASSRFKPPYAVGRSEAFAAWMVHSIADTKLGIWMAL